MTILTAGQKAALTRRRNREAAAKKDARKDKRYAAAAYATVLLESGAKIFTDTLALTVHTADAETRRIIQNVIEIRAGVK